MPPPHSDDAAGTSDVPGKYMRLGMERSKWSEKVYLRVYNAQPSLLGFKAYFTADSGKNVTHFLFLHVLAGYNTR